MSKTAYMLWKVGAPGIHIVPAIQQKQQTLEHTLLSSKEKERENSSCVLLYTRLDKRDRHIRQLSCEYKDENPIRQLNN